jgi:phosphohistidine phosphatase
MPKPRSRNTRPPTERNGAADGGRELYLVRHAIAAERGREWPDDTLRPLTARGMAKFERAVAGLANLKIVVDEVLTSPLVRAHQTADLLASGLSNRPPVRVLDALAPGHGPARVLEEVARVARGRRVALVGHEPGLGELAAFLIGARRAMVFKKGGVCRIDLEPGGDGSPGALVWFLTPKILRGLAE